MEARAVRNAVTSSALMRPTVLPFASKSVSEPRIVEAESSEDVVDVAAVEAAVGVYDEVCWSVKPEPCVLLSLLVELPDAIELTDPRGVEALIFSFPTNVAGSIVSNGERFTTLTPWHVNPLAGMYIDVDPSLRFVTMRSG
jgi:hypothetical protein